MKILVDKELRERLVEEMEIIRGKLNFI